MTTKISRNEKGNIITVDSKTGKKVGDILTMGDVIAEVEEKRKMREKAITKNILIWSKDI